LIQTLRKTVEVLQAFRKKLCIHGERRKHLSLSLSLSLSPGVSSITTPMSEAARKKIAQLKIQKLSKSLIFVLQEKIKSQSTKP
jgi:hypothetical protein